MALLYGQDLAYIQSAAFGRLARAAAPEIVRLLKNAATPIHRVVGVGCGAGVLTSALVEAGFDVTGVDCSADPTSRPWSYHVRSGGTKFPAATSDASAEGTHGSLRNDLNGVIDAVVLAPGQVQDRRQSGR